MFLILVTFSGIIWGACFLLLLVTCCHWMWRPRAGEQRNKYQALPPENAPALSPVDWSSPHTERFHAGEFNISTEEQKPVVEGPPRQPFLVLQPTEHLSVAFIAEGITHDPGDNITEAPVVWRHISEAPTPPSRSHRSERPASRQLPWTLEPV
jgi:hypothetical protein